MITLGQEEAEILLHTSRTGRYVTGDPQVIALAECGLLNDYGPQQLAGGDRYFTLSAAGREALNAWKEAQPQPQIRPLTRSQKRWQEYCAYAEAWPISFKAWLKLQFPKKA